MKTDLCESCWKAAQCPKRTSGREVCEDYEAISPEKQLEREEFVSAVMVGLCPQCRSKNTVDCEHEPSVDDITVGACLDCRTHWCLECAHVLKDRQETCPHWGFCSDCSAENDYMEGDEFREKVCPTCEHFNESCQLENSSECEKEAQSLCPYRQDISDCPKLRSYLKQLKPQGPEEEKNMPKKKNNVCAWCRKHIGNSHSVWGLSCTSTINLAKKEPYSIELALLSGKRIGAIVTSENSEAKADGVDFIFMCCSEKCA